MIFLWEILYSTMMLSSESSCNSSLKFNCKVCLLFIFEGDDLLLHLLKFLFFEELLFKIICLSAILFYWTYLVWILVWLRSELVWLFTWVFIVVSCKSMWLSSISMVFFKFIIFLLKTVFYSSYTKSFRIWSNSFLFLFKLVCLILSIFGGFKIDLSMLAYFDLTDFRFVYLLLL